MKYLLRIIALTCAYFALEVAVCSGQSASGLLAPNRYIDWSQAGAGSIPARTTICTTLGVAGQAPSFAQTVTNAAINSAIAACPSGQAVLLNPGTYNDNGATNSTSIVVTTSNVTLRGSGPTQTILKFNGTVSSSGIGTGAVAVYVSNGDGHQIGNTQNVLLVSSGMTQGSTSVVLGGVPAGTACGSQGLTPITCSGSISNLHVGSILIFNQQDDATETGNTIWNGSNFSQQTASGSNFRDRSQIQGVTVTGISGSTVTFTPAIYAPNWSSGKTPYATFSSTLPVSGFGIENLTIDTSSAANSGQSAALQFGWSTKSWVKNLSIVNSSVAGASFQNHVWITSSLNDTVQDTYMYGSSPTSGGYGIQMWQTGDSLSQNNICQHIATCQIQDGGEGNVWAYAYAVDNAYVGANNSAPGWQQCDIFHHSAGDGYSLFEGNIGICATLDDIHGTGNFITLFRNSLSGFDPNATNTKTQNLLTINNMAYARYNNFVANVLGYGGHATTYQYVMSSTTDCGSGNNGWVFALGDAIQNMSTCSPTPPNDVTANAAPQFSDVRWGNYDGVTGTVRTNSGETAATASTYPGLSTPSTSWASFPSLYLLARPSWWAFPSGNASTPWPGIGPEVTGGNIASTIGHAYLNPAANCYLNVLGGATNGSSGSFASTYDASACYPAVTPSWTITTATAGTGSGTISGCAGSHVAGSTFTCTVLPAAGSNITSVTGCGGSGTTNFTGTMPNNDCTVTATFNNTLSTPTFSPAAGSYLGTQTVSISIPSGTLALINAMQETSNANDLIGSAPHGNTYTNCATGYSGGQLQPAGQPVGTLYCTSADKTAAVAAGGPNNGVVTSTITGTGMTALDNGNGAGGSDSPTSVTATYGGVTGTVCGVHGAATSAYVPGLTFPDPGPNAQMVYGITTGSPGNSSILTVRKYNSSGDAGNYVAQRDCFTPNSVSVLGAHYESDYNYTTTGGTYMGFGKDYDIPNKHWRAAPQGQPWVVEELCPVAGGACLGTYNLPAGDSVLVESYEHWDAGCSYSSSTACAHYDALCLQLWNAGSPVNSMTCYNVRNASTHGTIDFIPINKTSWTHPQYAIQHQWDIDASSATLTATVPFSTAVAYNTTPTICYTTDGTTPTATTPGTCSHGSVYTGPLTISSSQTIKAIATQPGFTNSAVGSAAYTITPASNLTTVASNGAISGSNCSSGTYATGTSIGACTFTPSAGYNFTGWSGTGACSGASGTGTVSCTLSSDSTLTASTAPIVTCGDPSQLSPNFSGTYVVPPTVLPFTVGFTSPTAGCTMHYTSDGSAPTCSGTAYPGGNFTISSVGAYTYRVIACQTGYVSSNVVGGTWTVLSSSSVRVTLTGTQTITGQGTLQ